MISDSTELSASVSDVTRRSTLKIGGGLALAALLSSLGGRTVLAQQATPAAGEGLEGAYIVIRSRKLKAGKSGDELLAMVREGFVPIIESVPGFISYIVVANQETGDQFGVGIYADKAGADESNARAAEWGKLGASDYVEGDPVVIEGYIGVAAMADDE